MENENKKICKVGLWTKIWAFIGELMLTLLIVGCLGMIAYLLTSGYYYKPFHQIVNEAITEYAYDDMYYLANAVYNEDTAKAYYNCEQENIAYAKVGKRTYFGGMSNGWEYGDRSKADTAIYSYTDEIIFDNDNAYVCEIYLGYDFSKHDNYRNIYLIQQALYSLRYAVFVIALFSIVGWVFVYIFLLKCAGYEKGSDTPRPIFESYVPFEISLGLTALAIFFIAFFTNDRGFAINFGAEFILLLILDVLAAVCVFLVCSICFAIRVKTKYIWRTMLLRWVIVGLSKLFKLIGRGFRSMGQSMPLIWQAVLSVAGFATLFLIAASCIGHNGVTTGTDLFGWCLLLFCIIAFIAFGIYVAYMYRKLEQKTAQLSRGELNGELNTRFMLPVFNKHAQELETISGGIVISNEKRLASERTQSSLITNVSHDIKTPLTSIINYADLITREKSENEKINEYAEVLGRQSSRLKRLLEDLIEVSKAQSGALEVNLEPCRVATLLTQAAGEFEDRLNENNLDLIMKNTDSDVKILADPRRMWRVFDNLLGNICKYAQPFTRVYMSIEETPGSCRIVFKNTSSRELDMTPDELMERFVRGDKSREGADGNGLGLSIAANLIAIQKGNMDITIDGDLFKVTLVFSVFKDEITEKQINNIEKQ